MRAVHDNKDEKQDTACAMDPVEGLEGALAKRFKRCESHGHDDSSEQSSRYGKGIGAEKARAAEFEDCIADDMSDRM